MAGTNRASISDGGTELVVAGDVALTESQTQDDTFRAEQMERVRKMLEEDPSLGLLPEGEILTRAGQKKRESEMRGLSPRRWS